ncbi:MAG TPA: 3-deoxy-8-phosphooctulonate synthase [Acidobacteriota bacterium]|nr:3-deoxy-8-phosphooctulonate synthase [Acidobacteriota bacterium]HNB71317.1 3-deoxy-8-phosphooctulonate synthase [Acidobacteriota bacterium]HNG92091.1 3-deoxy-8-phosphooctulonate synthase [Acidobacteriota bacterium]HNJ39210.1 3-deoxy-8-phosphooctulonate synthase [Acidobacteriota bacterium]
MNSTFFPKPPESFFLIAGPCVIESQDHALFLAEAIQKETAELGIPYIFKASFDKANRSSIHSFRGPGLDAGLRVLEHIKKQTGLPVITDVHEIDQAQSAAEIVDVLQIPAFLCRQTDLLVAAARTGRTVNVKKGQFLAPSDMKNVVEKIREAGGKELWLTERGASFGYNNLVVDMRSFPIMHEFGCPVVFDVTHSLQRPGGLGNATGGDSQFIEPLARAGVACGVDGLFMEVHDNPSKALSDGPNALPLQRLRPLLRQLYALDQIRRQYPLLAGSEHEK